MKVSDSYDKHRRLKYKPFLGIQLKLLKEIIATESDIRAYKKSQNKERVEEARTRRRLLKVLGSTVAWVLLEFDRPYIRAFSRNLDPGFISGKAGLKGEVLALHASFRRQDYAGVLHDITNCLRIGDVSMIGPNHSIRTIEVKVVKNGGKIGGRGHRQKVRGQMIRDYYDTGRSTQLIPGRISVRHISEKRDRHNWRQLREVIAKAKKKGVASKVVEECLTYVAFRENAKDEALKSAAKTATGHLTKASDAMWGLLSEQFEIPSILPITCFELPLKDKEDYLFGEIGISIMVDLRRLAEGLTDRGFPSKIIRDRKIGFIRTKIRGLSSPVILSGVISRLLYEFASVDTIIGYTRELSQEAKDLISQNQS
jgi:hypothetical protein